MKKPVKIFQSLLNTAGKTSVLTHDTITPFEEKEKPLQNDHQKGLCAFTLFSAFTADIIKENTLFTR